MLNESDLLEKLAQKIDALIDRILDQREEILDLRNENDALVRELEDFKDLQSQWGQGLTSLLEKLDGFEGNRGGESNTPAPLNSIPEPIA